MILHVGLLQRNVNVVVTILFFISTFQVLLPFSPWMIFKAGSGWATPEAGSWWAISDAVVLRCRLAEIVVRQPRSPASFVGVARRRRSSASFALVVRQNRSPAAFVGSVRLRRSSESFVATSYFILTSPFHLSWTPCPICSHRLLILSVGSNQSPYLVMNFTPNPLWNCRLYADDYFCLLIQILRSFFDAMIYLQRW